jgi:hypothetical protein
MEGEKTVEHMNQPPGDGRLIADQSDASPFDEAAVIGKKDIQAEGRDGHEGTLPAEDEESLLPRLARGLAAWLMCALPALAGSFLAAGIASPGKPLMGAMAFLPIFGCLAMLAPLALHFTWERRKAPLALVLPAAFGLLVINWRLIFDAKGYILLGFGGAVRADLAWTEWTLLVPCLVVQSFLLWLVERRVRLFLPR